MKLLPFNPFSTFIFDSLMKLSPSKRFEVWRKARERVNDLTRQGKEADNEYRYAKQLYNIARSAYFWGG